MSENLLEICQFIPSWKRDNCIYLKQMTLPEVLYNYRSTVYLEYPQ